MWAWCLSPVPYGIVGFIREDEDVEVRAWCLLLAHFGVVGFIRRLKMLECRIRVYTEQRYDSHTDCEERVFQGTLSKKNEQVFVIYREEDEETGVKTTNQLKVAKDGSISVRRMGHVQSILHFAKEKAYTTFYNTGHGIMELVFIPTVVKYREEALAYEIELRYAIYMGESKLSENVYILQATHLA